MARAVTSRSKQVDETDLRLMNLLISNSDFSTKELALKLDVPLSTVQRRLRKLFLKSYLKRKYEINYDKLGYRKGLLHINFSESNTRQVARRVSKITGVTFVSVQLGTSDMLASFVYKVNDEVLAFIESVKKMPEVQNVIWSEEVFSIVAAMSDDYDYVARKDTREQ